MVFDTVAYVLVGVLVLIKLLVYAYNRGQLNGSKNTMMSMYDRNYIKIANGKVIAWALRKKDPEQVKIVKRTINSIKF